jgi:translation initiation factor IF-2
MTPPGPGTDPGVKKRLTRKRRTRVVENDEYSAFVRRVIAAYSLRVAAGDIDAITEMARLADDLDTAIHDAITGLRQRGYSWADIGTRLGITRQAAQQRWGGDSP